MGLTATCIGRIRKSGVATNGAFYDPSVSGVLSTTLNGSISTGATTIVVTSATGWPSSGNYYARIGTVGAETGTGSSEVVQVTGGQGTTSWTVTRGVLGTTALAFASGVVVDNSLAQCDTAVGSGSVGTSTASTTFVDAVFAAFNSTHVGLGLFLASGTGTTVGYYIIQSVTNSTTVVLDAVSGTYTAGVWKLGGASDTFQTLATKVVAGNTTYIRASAGNASSYPTTSLDYTISGFFTATAGTTGAGLVKWIGEAGMPTISSPGLGFYNAQFNEINGLYVVAVATTNGNLGTINVAGSGTVKNCIVNMNIQAATIGIVAGAGSTVSGNEVYGGSASPTASTGADGINITATGVLIDGNKVHGCRGKGISLSSTTGGTIFQNEVYGCVGDGIATAATSATMPTTIDGNTIDSNTGNGITVSATAGTTVTQIKNNIISNNGGYGISCTAGSTALNDRSKLNWGYNDVYNNTSGGYQNVSASTTDLNVNPNFVGGSPFDYTPQNAALKAAFPTAF